MIKDIKFPVQLEFKISTLSNDFTARDADGKTIAFVKQKLLKFKEGITVYEDETKSKVDFKINADRWIDFSAAYNFTDSEGKELGKVARKGWRSIWRAAYEIIDQNAKLQYHIRESNAWVKVGDALLGEIPIIGMFTGYLFNPTYDVTDLDGKVILKLKKTPSFFGRRFQIEKLEEIDSDDDERVILALMMMVLLERRRG